MNDRPIWVLSTGRRTDHIFWQLLHPAQPGGSLETIIHALPGRLSQPRRSTKIAGGDGMAKSFGLIPDLLIPLAGAKMEFCNFYG